MIYLFVGGPVNGERLWADRDCWKVPARRSFPLKSTRDWNRDEPIDIYVYLARRIICRRREFTVFGISSMTDREVIKALFRMPFKAETTKQVI